MQEKLAHTDHPVHELIAGRWSPYAFDSRPVTAADLTSLFEAARWAPSSYNEQPWSYIVATKDDPKQFADLLSCLVDGNQGWAKDVPVLALGLFNHKFSRNGKDNKAAAHDLGTASANLSTEATARGLSVHQMIGIIPERARELYALPENIEALTGIAIGYRAPREKIPEGLKERDLAPRQRKPLSQFVFSGKYGEPALVVTSKK